ncbi:MAG: response regulator transcription factor [Proteobacteria bacterium]|nr:response regulator transcription factor [Pseudomonadota bacterium]
MKIRVLLADDHTVLREGLKYILEAQRDITVIGEASDGREAVERVVTLKPDVVVMDISMRDLNGIEATEILSQSCPFSKIVILSIHAKAEYVNRALRSGARGYVLKESASKEVIDAVRQVQTGGRYLSNKIMDAVVDDYIASDLGTIKKSPIESLSLRERQVLQLVVEGHTSIKIAEIIGISVKTVETYRSRMMQKLGVGDVISLVKYAIRHGLTTID